MFSLYIIFQAVRPILRLCEASEYKLMVACEPSTTYIDSIAFIYSHMSPRILFIESNDRTGIYEYSRQSAALLGKRFSTGSAGLHVPPEQN